MASSTADAVIDKSTLSDIYITDALTERPLTPANPSREKEAVLGLAAAMADRPAEVLPDFVALAMELTGATSAGLSLFEEQPGDGVFRWRHLHGMLSPFEDALTPRMDSPCGVTLDQNRPVLARHPEQIYDWISAHDIIVPEVLLVPLYIGSAEPLGTLWVVAPEVGHFNAEHARITAELAGFVGSALKMIRTETRLRFALDEQEIIAREMSHRLKNLFAMTDGLIRSSARGADNVDDMAEALSGRLHALADAHALVQRKATALGSDDRSIDLADL
ncbi:MAG: histidine kinase, partial [Sphingomonadales bacterium]